MQNFNMRGSFVGKRSQAFFRAVPRALLMAVLCAMPAVVHGETGWTNLLDKVDTNRNAVAGDWTKTDGSLAVNATQSARISLPFQPQSEYDFRVKFTRTSGVHSIALFFVTASGPASFEIDAWGEHLAGIQDINGRDIRSNATRSTGHTLENGKTYTALVEVRRDTVKTYLDGKLITTLKTADTRLSIPAVWRMPDAKSLGLGAYSAATTFHSAEVRTRAAGQPLASTPSTRPEPITQPSPKPTPGTQPVLVAGKRVLLVIANEDFFYREYAEPLRELQRAGITVDVAAGRKAMCTPHPNSGQSGSGAVMPDLALADAKASQYDAIMFSGGWGSSMYQYAFRGSYDKRAYNGNPQTKAVVNRLLNDFVSQKKIVGALCHGVSVLAWARVDGKSILAGRRAVGSPRQSPSGVYNGRRGQPLSRWNAETNGARLSPARSMGNPSTSADDVLVDGNLITGEDDNSATLFGATLARMLAK